jgi:hypothetical protein
VIHPHCSPNPQEGKDMDFDLVSALWMALFTIVLIFALRITAGVAVNQENKTVQLLGQSLATIIG